MSWVAEFLAVLLAGLTGILAVVGAMAAARLRDTRLAFVTGSLVLLAVVGALAFLHEVSPLYGQGFGVDPIPLALTLGGAVLLYGSLFRRRANRSPH